jgi:hypothetical protein
MPGRSGMNSLEVCMDRSSSDTCSASTRICDVQSQGTNQAAA